MLETEEQLIAHVKQFPDSAHAFASLRVTKVSLELSEWFYSEYSDNGGILC